MATRLTGTEHRPPPGPRPVSVLPGRRRYVWPVLREHESACRALEEWLASWPGVREVRTYPLSGALVLQFDPERLDVNRLEQALAGWQPPPRAARRLAADHRAHDLWGALLLGQILLKHLLLDRQRPFRGQRPGHLVLTLALAGLTPLLRGAPGFQPHPQHLLELLLIVASLVMRENYRTVAALALLHAPELIALARGVPRSARPTATGPLSGDGGQG